MRPHPQDPYTADTDTTSGPRRAFVAGFAAASAYLGAMVLDRRLTHNEYDDLLLWGGTVNAPPRIQKLLGLLVHFTLGSTLAIAYSRLIARLPRWPGWLRGIAFVQAENALLFPAVLVMDRFHPAVRSGRLPRLFTLRFFLLETWRHLAYGAVLGTLVTHRQSEAASPQD